jgi:drug/metabolite transporter, DME family
MRAAAVLLSTGGLFIKLADIDALGLSMWRSLVAFVALLAFVRPANPLRSVRDPLTLSVAASYAGMLLTLVIATRMTTAANAIFLQFTGPLYVAVFAGLILRERTTRLDIVSLVVAFAGMALFFAGEFEATALAGNLFGVAAGVCFAAFLLFLRAPGAIAVTRQNGVILGNGGLFLVFLPVNALRGEPAVFTPSLADIGCILFLGVVQIGLAYVFFTKAMGLIPALEAALVNMVEPVLNPVWVAVFLGETPGWLATLGGAIVVGALMVRALLTQRSTLPGRLAEA